VGFNGGLVMKSFRLIVFVIFAGLIFLPVKRSHAVDLESVKTNLENYVSGVGKFIGETANFRRRLESEQRFLKDRVAQLEERQKALADSFEREKLAHETVSQEKDAIEMQQVELRGEVESLREQQRLAEEEKDSLTVRFKEQLQEASNRQSLVEGRLQAAEDAQKVSAEEVARLSGEKKLIETGLAEERAAAKSNLERELEVRASSEKKFREEAARLQEERKAIQDQLDAERATRLSIEGEKKSLEDGSRSLEAKLRNVSDQAAKDDAERRVAAEEFARHKKELEGQLAEAARKNEELAAENLAEIAAKESALAEQRFIADEQQKQNEELRKEADELTAQTERIMAKLDKREQETKAEFERLQNDFDRVSRERDDARIAISNTVAENAKQKEQIEQLTSSLAQSKSQVEAISEEKAGVEAGQVELRSKLQSLQDRLSGKEEAEKVLKAQLEDQREAIRLATRDFAEKIAAAERSFHEVDAQLQKEKRQHEEYKEEAVAALESCAAEIETVGKEYAEGLKKLRSLNSEITLERNVLKRDLEKSDFKLAQSESDLWKARHEFIAFEKKKEDEIERIDEKYRLFRERHIASHDRTQSELEEMREKAEALDKEKDEIVRKNASDREVLTERIKLLDDKRISLGREVQLHIEERDEEKKKAVELEYEVEDMRGDLIGAAAMGKKLVMELNQKNIEIEELRSSLSQFEATKKQMEEFTTERASIEARISGLEKAIKELNKEKVALETKLVEQKRVADNALTAITKERDDFEKRFNKAYDDVRKTSEHALKVIHEGDKLKYDLKAKDVQIRELRAELAEITQELSRFEASEIADISPGIEVGPREVTQEEPRAPKRLYESVEDVLSAWAEKKATSEVPRAAKPEKKEGPAEVVPAVPGVEAVREEAEPKVEEPKTVDDKILDLVRRSISSGCTITVDELRFILGRVFKLRRDIIKTFDYLREFYELEKLPDLITIWNREQHFLYNTLINCGVRCAAPDDCSMWESMLENGRNMNNFIGTALSKLEEKIKARATLDEMKGAFYSYLDLGGFYLSVTDQLYASLIKEFPHDTDTAYEFGYEMPDRLRKGRVEHVTDVEERKERLKTLLEEAYHIDAVLLQAEDDGREVHSPKRSPEDVVRLPKRKKTRSVDI